MQKIIVGGVPEHFNLPWHYALENNLFKNKNIHLKWRDFPDGTGAMAKALREEKIDLAVILTEGIIKDIIAGNPSKIIKIYVETPLLWGIHVGANAPMHNIKDLTRATAAISRFGSGSHLMARVMAKSNKLNEENLSYQIIENLDGAIKTLPNNDNLFFMWEYFTTKPYVDNGIFKRIDTVATPWPCFVIAVRDKVLENNTKTVKTIIEIINKVLKKFNQLSFREELIPIFAKNYNLPQKDVKHWLNITHWNTNINIAKGKSEKILKELLRYDIIENKIPLHKLIYNL
ncbi:MAG: ABC transporter substrate-binding protein [Flavobacteriales bacterium]|nr:MAG: ABC transporter substrate-binding protein [Flavobacteriales bacterium]